MNRRPRHIVQYAVCLLLGAMTWGILCPAQALAQTGPPLAQKTDRWTVNYHVTVRGEFTIEPEPGSDGPVVTYKIEHLYSGLANVVFEARSLYTVGDEWRPRFVDPHPEVTIEINDSRTSLYDWLCEERESVEETWKGKIGITYGAGYGGRRTQLMIDNNTRRYEISYPLFYKSRVATSTNDEVTYVRKRFTEKLGDGERRLLDTKTDHKSFDLYQVPDVAGYVKNTTIIGTDTWSALKSDAAMNGGSVDSFYWMSPELHPDANVFPGVPKDKVQVHVWYDFKRFKG